jgi:hypothetical protein
MVDQSHQFDPNKNIMKGTFSERAHGSIVVSGIVLQAGRSRV